MDVVHLAEERLVHRLRGHGERLEVGGCPDARELPGEGGGPLPAGAGQGAPQSSVQLPPSLNRSLESLKLKSFLLLSFSLGRWKIFS